VEGSEFSLYAMSSTKFIALYEDGTEVFEGDVIESSGRITVITRVFSPENEISRMYDMQDGCVEIAPHTIEVLPLNEDIKLIRRRCE